MREGGKQTDSEGGRQADRQAGRQADRQAGRKGGRQTGRKASRYQTDSQMALLHFLHLYNISVKSTICFFS